jgi:deazaflavin-dependent oxidoreductase (nitroreductase family)
MTLESRRSLLDRLKHSNEVTITVTGRKTKKRFSTPVWFVLDEEKVILVPMKGSDNEWYKDLVEEPQIELGVDGITIPFKAKLVRGPAHVEKALDGFRAKYKSMWSESYYTKRDVYVEVPVSSS